MPWLLTPGLTQGLAGASLGLFRLRKLLEYGGSERGQKPPFWLYREKLDPSSPFRSGAVIAGLRFAHCAIRPMHTLCGPFRYHTALSWHPTCLVHRWTTSGRTMTTARGLSTPLSSSGSSPFSWCSTSFCFLTWRPSGSRRQGAEDNRRLGVCVCGA